MGFLNFNPQNGAPVPGADLWQLQNGTFAPMSPMEIFLKDTLGWGANQAISPTIGKATDAIKTNRNKLKEELDKLNK